MPRVLPHPSSAVHRAWRAILVICCSIPLVTCSEDTPVGPHGFGFGTVRVTPAFNANASLVPLTLDQVQVIVVRPAAETLKVINQSFDQDSTQVHVQVSDIQLHGSSEDLDVTIRLFAGPTLLFSGTQTVHVTSGAAPPPTSIPVVYEGPGANVAAIQIGPRDSTLLLGTSFSYRATATDSQSAPVTQFYVSWGSSAGKINAAGTFTAPSQRGKIVIRAATPSGAKDSTTVSITAPAASLAKSGGDAQSALAGSRLPQLLAVEVVGSDGLPVSGVAVGFATAGGGSVDSATATSDSLGIARTGAVLGLVPGPQTFTASATGLASVTFNETATAGLTRTWTGAVSTDWSTAGNWNPSAIPDNTVDVVIPPGLSRYPALTASGSAKTITVNTGATLGLGALNLQVGGNVFADGAITGGGAVQIAASAQVRGSISNLILSGAAAASGALIVSGNITVTGASGNFSVNGQTVTVGGAVTTQGGGLLTMTNALDQLSITGDAAFGGGTETGLLTAGVLRIGGNFSQTVTGTSFAASGAHLTTFTGSGAHTVSFANPTTSQFQGLDLSQATGGVTLLSDAKAAGQLTSTPASGTPLVTTTATPRVFTVGGVNVTGLRVDKMELVIGSGTVGSFNNVQFTNSPTTSPQLAISNPGAATAYTFINVSFATTPTAPNGFYVSATDVNTGDGLPLVINMIAPTPAAPGAFVSTAGGATVNWPAGIIWTGAVSTNWSTAGNWSSGTVPTAADNVTIPSGTPNSPVLTAASAVNGVTVLAGGSLNLGGFTLTTNGNVLVSSPITNGTLAMAGAGQLSGSVPTLNVNAAVTAIGNVTVTGTLTISGATAGYTVAGHTTTVTGSIQTASGGTLTMTNAADSVIVINSVSMNGGATTGLLTNGVMVVEGNFTQLGAATFAASGSHKTVLSWSGLGAVPIVSFADPVNSHFQDLDATLANRDSLLTNVSVLGRLISTPSATPSTFKSVAGAAVSAAGVDVTGLTLDGVTLSIGSGAITAFSGVTFQNQSATATQLTVNNPGQAAAFTFTNLKFLTVPSTGFYLKATDADGTTPNVLVINMANASPYQGGAFFQVANGAIVNWPPAPVWVGTTSTDWSTATNWSFGAVPQATDSVVIGPAANQPSLSQNVSVGAVNITSGTLTMGGHALAVARTLATTATGALAMTNTADTLTVGGNASFNGAAETGKLTAGLLQVAGSFSQAHATSAASFIATAGHTVLLNGAAPQTVTFADSVTSAFGNLTITNLQVTVASLVQVAGNLNVGPGVVVTATDTTINGKGFNVLGNVDVTSTATLRLGRLYEAGVLTSAGTYAVTSTIFTGASQTAPPSLTYGSVYINGTVTFGAGSVAIANNLVVTTTTASLTLGGATDVSGSIFVQNGKLILNNQQLSDAGNLTVTGNGTVKMVGANEVFQVAGNVTFDGGSTNGLLTAGTLYVGGNFTQLATSSTQSFAADTGHLTRFTSLTPTISFATPGVSDSSHFGSVQSTLYLPSPTLNLASDVVIRGYLTGGDGFNGTINGTTCGVALTVQTIVPAQTNFNCATLVIYDSAGRGAGLSNVSFSNLPSTATQLTIKHPGVSAGAFSLNNITWIPLTTGNTGFYVSATDLDGPTPNQLVVNVASNDPGNGPSFTQTSGGAAVYWPAGVVTWTGGAGTSSWTNPSNWSTGAVPTTSDSVVIVASTTTPVLAAPTTVLAVNVASGTLTVGGQVLTVLRSLATTGTGTLTMTNSADNVIVGGDANFSGGSTLNLLTSGILTIGGNFTQSAVTSTTSFAPSGTHMTLLGSPSARVINFGSPGDTSAGSHFQNLNITGATGGLSLTVNTIVDSAFIAVAGTGQPLLLGGGASLTAREWLVSGLTVDNAPMILNENGLALSEQFDNVTFQNMGTAAVSQLTVVGPGGFAAPRTLTFNATTFTHLATAGVGAYYVNLQPTTGTLNITMQGSSEGTTVGGNGSSFTLVTGNGVVNWP